MLASPELLHNWHNSILSTRVTLTWVSWVKFGSLLHGEIASDFISVPWNTVFVCVCILNDALYMYMPVCMFKKFSITHYVPKMFRKHSSGTSALHWNRDEKLLNFCSFLNASLQVTSISKDGLAIVWDAESGKKVQELKWTVPEGSKYLYKRCR